MRYKILIVDDEPLIVKGLASMLQRIGSSKDIEVITAQCGDEAVHLMERENADILLTDISMPEMNGLELLRTIKLMKPDTVFIVLSGYDHFSYVNAAYQLGILDYLRKPVRIGELEKVIVRAVNQAGHACGSHNLLTEDRLSTKIGQVMLENAFSIVLESNQRDPYQVSEAMKDIQSHWLYSYSVFGVIHLDDQMQRQKNAQIEPVLNKLDQSFLSDKPVQIFHLYTVSKSIVSVFALASPDLYEQVRQYYYQLQKIFAKEWSKKPACAISDVSDCTKNIESLYRQALKTLDYRLIHPNRFLFEYSSYLKQQQGNQGFTADIKEYFAGLTVSNREKISKAVDALFDEKSLKSCSIDVVRNNYEELLQITRQLQLDAVSVCSEEKMKQFSDFLSLAELRRYLKDRAERAIRYTKANKQIDHIDRAVQFIRRNYMREMSMAEAANDVSLNYSYFSTLFSEKTGMSFNRYLTTVRMEEASRLLLDPAYRINDTALKVGYRNPKHFARAFKAFYGLSPSDYRKTHNQ